MADFASLATIVPRLPPELIHRVIKTRGLEDCAELVALATPAQLARVLDADVWRARTAGADEAFDADRFGLWIAVLMEAGPDVAADKLAGLDLHLVIEGFARHLRVFDHAAVAPYVTLDGEDVPGREKRDGPVSEIGGYVIEANQTSAREPMLDLLAFVAAEQGEFFHRLMRGCVRLSSGRREEDGFHGLRDDREQHLFDLSAEREARREEQGYVPPAQAHAFLREAREVRLDADQPPQSVLARAYLRTLESIPISSPDDPSVVQVLEEAGLVTPPRALLGAGETEPAALGLVEAHVRSHLAAEAELAYLANVMTAACVVQGRPISVREAADGVLAIANLGLENWPPSWTTRDLIAAFEIGWAILHRDVCMFAARRLIAVLDDVRCVDREIQLRLDGLRRQLIRHTRAGAPWSAREALDEIMMLDAAAWAALDALIAECPMMHAATDASRRRCRAIDPADVAFIAGNSQIHAVREFLASLPSVLAG